MKNKKTAIVFAIVAVFVVIVVILSNVAYTSTVVLGGKTFSVTVAETKYFQERGLSGHDPLRNNEGMFFVFGKPDNYGFWMKDMKFPIDIIWFGADFKITHIEKAVDPNTYPKVFYPDTPSLYVLEVASGQSETLNLKIGDVIKFERKVSKNL